MEPAPLHRSSHSLHSLLNPFGVIAGSWRSRGLISALSRTEVMERYRGSVFGILWSFIVPLVMIAVYTFVFSGVFKARWKAGGDESPLEFGVASHRPR